MCGVDGSGGEGGFDAGSDACGAGTGLDQVEVGGVRGVGTAGAKDALDAGALEGEGAEDYERAGG